MSYLNITGTIYLKALSWALSLSPSGDVVFCWVAVTDPVESYSLLKQEKGDILSSPVVKTSPSSAGGVGSLPGWQEEIPYASQPKNQDIKQKQYCNKLNKGSKTGQQNLNKS